MNKEALSSAEKEALMFASDLFKNQLPAQYLYHDYNHTLETTGMCQIMASHYQLDNTAKHVLILASIFHDTGHTVDYKSHENESALIARKYLQDKNYADDIIHEIEKLILSTHHDHQPQNLLEEILHDADIINLGKKNFFNMGNLLRLEWEFFLNKLYSDEEWERMQLEFLSSHKFLTSYAQEQFGVRRKKNIEKQKEIVNRKIRDNKKEMYSKIGSGVETVYHSTYRNHIDLISIADNKANMIICMNTIIMSVIIIIYGASFTFNNNPFIQHKGLGIPISILLLTCLLSVIFAIFSARPSITRKENHQVPTVSNDTSLLFFGNFTNMPLQDYIKDMDALMTNQQELYHSLTIDIYYLGKSLEKKYNLLRSSYNIFMVGIMLAVITFIVIFLYSPAQQ